MPALRHDLVVLSREKRKTVIVLREDALFS